jgi:hypothetical protein
MSQYNDGERFTRHSNRHIHSLYRATYVDPDLSTDIRKAQWFLSLRDSPKFSDLSEDQRERIKTAFASLTLQYEKLHHGKEDWRDYCVQLWYSRIRDGLRRLTFKWKPYRGWKVRRGRYHVAVIGYRDKTLAFLPAEASWSDELAESIYEAMRILVGRLRCCRRFSCSKLFIRIKRQLYCSSKCANQASLKRYRKRHAWKMTT